MDETPQTKSETLPTRQAKLKDGWYIGHPGTAELLQVNSFDEAMNVWFEGFNLPFQVSGGVQEPFAVSYSRVQQHLHPITLGT